MKVRSSAGLRKIMRKWREKSDGSEDIVKCSLLEEAIDPNVEKCYIEKTLKRTEILEVS